MTAALSDPAAAQAVQRIVAVARRIDAPGMTPLSRANAALTYVLERDGTAWPLDRQRLLLEAAVQSLGIAAEPKRAAAPPAPDALQGSAPRRPETETAGDAPAARAPATGAPAKAAPPGPSAQPVLQDIPRDLAQVLDFSALAAQSPTEQQTTIREAVHTLCEARRLQLNRAEIDGLVTTILADMLGLGPLEALMADDSITDIMVNGADRVYVERGGKLELCPARFRDNDHVMAVASRIVGEVGRRIDEAQPMVDARLKDGSRVNVAVPPLAIDGPAITIRKFPKEPVRLDALVEKGSLSAQMAALLGLASVLRLNMLIAGGTGSGKTTLLNALSGFIPQNERIVTIEDAAELRLLQPHVVRFETRPPNVEGSGEVTIRTLMRNALRMRPDRIIIGEVRGEEVLDLLQAMNTGHDGSMSTLHANSPREALTRIENMAALAGFAAGPEVVRRQLADAVQLVIQVSRMRDGRRRVTSVSEIVGRADEAITLQEIFQFRVSPDSTRDTVRGSFVHSGYRPAFAVRAADYGLLDDLDRILGG